MKILYAADGGHPAMQAQALLERVVASEKAQITAVTVGGLAADETIEANASTPGAGIVESAVSQLREAGFRADKRLLDGEPAPAILKEIDEGEFQLTVLGAGNRTWMGRLLLGSVSTKVLHASPTSIMIVHRFSDASSPVRVLLGTDGSKFADRALEQVIALMDPSSCEVRVLSVAEHLMPHLTFPIPREAHATSAPTPEQESEWIAAAQRPATAAVRKLERAGFTADALAVLGAPATRLLAEAENFHADLVVVGSRGLGAVSRIALGSVSDQIVRESAAAFVARS